MTGVTGSLWMLQLTNLSLVVASLPDRLTEDQRKIACIIESSVEVTVADVVALTGIDQATARRCLDAITPLHARLIEGRPKRWRKVEG